MENKNVSFDTVEFIEHSLEFCKKFKTEHPDEDFIPIYHIYTKDGKMMACMTPFFDSDTKRKSAFMMAAVAKKFDALFVNLLADTRMFDYSSFCKSLGLDMNNEKDRKRTEEIYNENMNGKWQGSLENAPKEFISESFVSFTKAEGMPDSVAFLRYKVNTENKTVEFEPIEKSTSTGTKENNLIKEWWGREGAKIPDIPDEILAEIMGEPMEPGTTMEILNGKPN